MSRITRFAAIAGLPFAALSVCIAAPHPTGAVAGAQANPAEQRLLDADTNGDQRISLAEYLAAAEARFKTIDQQQKGKIDAADLASSPGATARIDHRAESIIARLDTAGNGYVTRDEYLAAAQGRFARIDVDADGKLTADELAGSHRHAKPDGAHGDHSQSRFEKLDSNHDGVVTREEFMAAASEKFAKLDAAGDGKVTAEDIETSPKTQERALHVAERFISRMDANADGTVTREEFLAAAKARFAKMDRNGDGYLDADEAQAGRWSGHGHAAGPG